MYYHWSMMTSIPSYMQYISLTKVKAQTINKQLVMDQQYIGLPWANELEKEKMCANSSLLML
jgi:hypothetical protein